MTIEESELREKIAREIRIAMSRELHDGNYHGQRQDQRETVADEHADAIMAMIAALGAKP
jgi:hypothetical protein